ncbi:hypothetical protein BVC93_16985 [Mycobacterium sp. MS1601]|nr:hypothetical protein BVC93_16985 [Mycobacterium sp. MS1601]
MSKLAHALPRCAAADLQLLGQVDFHQVSSRGQLTRGDGPGRRGGRAAAGRADSVVVVRQGESVVIW